MSVPPKRRRSLGGATLKAGNAGLFLITAPLRGQRKKSHPLVMVFTGVFSNGA